MRIRAVAALMVDASAPHAQSDPPAMVRRRPLFRAALALAVVGWAALAMGAATPLRSLAERRAGEALGRTVSIGGPLRIMVTPFSISLSAAKVHVANPAWANGTALLDAGQVTARLATFDLLLGKPAFRALSITDATLDLERAADGKTVNWSNGERAGLFNLLAIRRIDADRVTLRYRDPAGRTDARLALSSGGGGLVDMSGGGLIHGRDVTLSGSVRSSDDMPATIDMRARTPAFALRLEGDAETPLRLGTARFRATARGDDFAGLAALGGIGLSALPPYALTAHVTRLRNGGWHFSHIGGRIGGTDLAGTLTLTHRRARPLVVASLSSRALDGRDAGMPLIRPGGTPVDAPPPDDGRVLPDALLTVEALRRFDALVDYRADRLAGLDHAPAHLVLKLALMGGRMQITPASVDLAGGFISSDIFIDARGSPALLRADIRLSPTPMGRLLHDWGIAPAGTTAMVKGRVQLAGRGETLREAIGNADGRIALVLPAGAVRTRQASASTLDMANLGAALFDTAADGTSAPAALNCGLIAFTVRGGVARADPILIDTAGSILSGTGAIDLRDERIALRLKPDAKAAGWFDRPSPVTIAGTLGKASVTREPVDWFRPARLFGISVLLPDLRRMFGFVDPGEADAPACGPILRAAPAAAQRGRELASLP